MLVLRSPMHAAQQSAGLEKRLATAATKLAALTPARGRGKRQMTDEGTLVEAIDNVLKEQRVEGLLRIAWEQQSERHTHYVGRGRGSATREQRVSERIRYHITRITRQDGPIAAVTGRFGWKAFVTNAAARAAVVDRGGLCYRNEYAVERIFNRLKSVCISPRCLSSKTTNRGFTYLLTLGVRVLTVTEFVLRRSLAQEQVTLPGLHPENKRKRTGHQRRSDSASVWGVSLTIIQSCREGNLRRITPLSAVQEAILHRRGWVLIATGSLQFRIEGVDGANGEMIHSNRSFFRIEAASVGNSSKTFPSTPDTLQPAWIAGLCS